LQQLWDEFDSRHISAIAIAQEDKDLASHAKFLEHFKEPIAFKIVADLNRMQSTAYDRTTAYLVDREGIVRQVFPMMIHHRATWRAVLNEADRLGLK